MVRRELINQTLNFAKGHQKFKDIYFKQHEKEFVRLVEEGQNPQTLFIGCSDSRIVPDLILNTKPGDLFVIRTAGNFVPRYQADAADGISASIQFAVEILNVRHIIICGHSHCGAIEALFKNTNETGSNSILERWLKLGQEARDMTLKTTKSDTSQQDLCFITGQISIIYQLENLLTFPVIKKKVDDGALDLHGWYYHIETGDVTYYNSELYQFISLTNMMDNEG